MERHDLMGGHVYVFKRPRSRYWQCGTYLEGRKLRTSTKQESLEHAKDFAEHWYFDLRGKQRAGELRGGKTFAHVAEVFRKEYRVITHGDRSEKYIESQEMRLDVHLIPYFGAMVISEITPGKVQEYRVHRMQPPEAMERRADDAEPPKPFKPPARNTLHQEIVALRQVLKTAHRHGWLPYLPDLSPPYKTSPKITHRGWFSPAEYKQLYEATRRRAKNPPNPRWKHECEQIHDWVLFMGNTGLRPDEAGRLQYRDVTVVEDRDSGETILEIEVRGKRGIGFCKSTSGAVRPFERLKERNSAAPTDLIFPSDQRELFNAVLEEEGLKIDRDGNSRTAYSLRHTYICLRLMEGADIYQMAKNCRTSVEMIEKFYARHIQNTLDAAAINVRRSKPQRHPPNSGRKRKDATPKRKIPVGSRR